MTPTLALFNTWTLFCLGALALTLAVVLGSFALGVFGVADIAVAALNAVAYRRGGR